MEKTITFFGHKSCVLACDGQCNKAWGINGRPKQMLSEGDPDDYVFLSDDALGEREPPSHCPRVSGLLHGDERPRGKN